MVWLFYCLEIFAYLSVQFRTIDARSPAPSSISVVFKELKAVEPKGVYNVHIEYTRPINGEISILYGDCNINLPSECHHRLGSTFIGSHPLAKRHTANYRDSRPTRFVWLTPEDIQHGGCLHAYAQEELVGRSTPITVMSTRLSRRDAGIDLGDIADSWGPWFDSVEYLTQKEPDQVFVSQAKSKYIGIVGGGMSGLMAGFLLHQAGIHNFTILEASERIGGRIHTSYLNGTRPDQYQYQEMGPMRFPVSITYENETIPIKDHQLVFQLAAAINDRNGNQTDLAIKFIKWNQSSKNTPRSTANATAQYSNATAAAEAQAAYAQWAGIDAAHIADTLKELGSNVFAAHKKAVENGLFDWSESQYIRYVLNKNLNLTDQIDSTSDLDPTWLYDTAYFAASDWLTIDKGLASLWRGMEPFMLNRTKLHTRVAALTYAESTSKMTVKHRATTADPFTHAPDEDSSEFDYVFVTVPFSVVRSWRMKPAFPSLLTRAINTMNYAQSCKVALHYKTRFWEHLDSPIYGGCGSSNVPLLGSICYPSYQINSTGPGVILASYASGTAARTLGSMSEADHAAYAQRAMVEVHGPIAAEQFTGIYDRVCWEFSPYQAGAWCDPLVGQQELYLPAYFRTEMNTVFIGEHTSFTHAWIWSALESAVRGTVQLLLEMGLVDEAKEVVDIWMARWISV